MTFDDMRRELEQQVRITARRATITWEEQVERGSPVDTGLMKSRVRMRDSRTSTGFKIEGTVDTDYAEYVSRGTRPHVIRPRNREALRFQVGGTTVYATRVNHPGTRPNDFWTRPLSELPRTLETIWRQVTA